MGYTVLSAVPRRPASVRHRRPQSRPDRHHDHPLKLQSQGRHRSQDRLHHLAHHHRQADARPQRLRQPASDLQRHPHKLRRMEHRSRHPRRHHDPRRSPPVRRPHHPRAPSAPPFASLTNGKAPPSSRRSRLMPAPTSSSSPMTSTGAKPTSSSKPPSPWQPPLPKPPTRFPTAPLSAPLSAPTPGRKPSLKSPHSAGLTSATPPRV